MKVPRLSRFRLDLRREIEERLLSGDFESYRSLAREVSRRIPGRISKSALHAHHQRLKNNKKEQR